MPTFAFTARDDAGRTQTGLLEAASSALAIGQIRERGWLVLRVQEQSTASAAEQGTLSLWRRPSSVALELSLRQLAVMLRGGISLLSALETLTVQSESKGIRAVYQLVIAEVQQGRSFSDAMEQQPSFPGFLVRLARVGERTGILEGVLERGADVMRTRRETVREVMAALTYPAIVLVAAVGATTFMLTTLIPKLTKLLESLGKPLPPMTQSLVTVSNFFQQYGPAILTVMGISIISLILTYLSPSGRLLIDKSILRIPVVGKILRLSGTLTFSQTLGALIESGVSVLDSLVTVQQMHNNQHLAGIIQRSRDAIIRGQNLADTLRARGAFMPLLATMTAVGEETGNLDDVMKEVSDFHRSQLSSLIRTLSAWATPVIVIVVGSIVGYVYIAFFLALFSVAR